MKISKLFLTLGITAMLASCGPTTSSPSNPTSSEEPTTEPSITDPTTSEEDPTTLPTTSENVPNVITISQDTFSETEGYVANDKNISFACYQGGGTTTPVVNDGVIRLYQPAAGNESGGYITISAAEGVKILSLDVKTAMETSAYHVADGVTSSVIDVSVDNYYSVEGEYEEISIHCVGADKKHRFYVSEIKVSYVGGSVTPGGSEDDPIVPPELNNWTPEEIAIMEEHLQSNVLPFYNFNSYNLYWDEEYSCVSIESLDANSNAIHDYANILEQNGYEVVYTYEDDGFYEYGLQLSDISTLFVDIYEDETRGTCVDAYIYELETEWPADLIQEFLDYYSVTDEVPAYTAANTYEVYDLYWEYGLYAVYCYTDETDPVATYTSVLEQTGLTVEYDTDYELYYALSASGTLEIDFYHDTEYSCLVVDIYVLE